MGRAKSSTLARREQGVKGGTVTACGKRTLAIQQQELGKTQQELSNARAEIQRLEKALSDACSEAQELMALLALEKASVLQLSGALSKAESKLAEACATVTQEKSRSANLYKSYRVERCAHQCALSHRGVLEEQISLLRLADRENSDEHKAVISNAGRAIETLLKVEKENKNLRSELSACFERSYTEIQASCQKLVACQKDLQKAHSLTRRLQKTCNLATEHQKKAIMKAREQALKERSTQSLLKKVSILRKHVTLYVCLFKQAAQRTI